MFCQHASIEYSQCVVTTTHATRYCTKTTQGFFGHVFFSVTETDVTIKIYKEYSKMDWKRMKQMKQTNSSSHWWSVSFVSFVTKQDETVQTPWSVLVTKQGVT